MNYDEMMEIRATGVKRCLFHLGILTYILTSSPIHVQEIDTRAARALFNGGTHQRLYSYIVYSLH